MPLHEFPLSGAINLDVRIGVGTITVRAEDDVSVARVELEARRPGSDILERTTVEMAGATLTIRGPKAQGWSLDKLFSAAVGADHLVVDVVVPSGTAMKLASYSARTDVTGRAGSVHIATGAGATTVEQVDGDLLARFGSGSIEVGTVTGSAAFKYGSGNARVTDVAGGVDVACGSGGLELGTAHGPVRARTGSGAITIGRAQRDVEAGTGSGTVAVGLEPGKPARLDITTGHGRVISELDITDTAPSTSTDAITIRARSGSGDIRLFRAVA